MQREIGKRVFGAHPGMSQAVRVGQMVTLSGQVALDGKGDVVGEGDAARQVAQIFHNIETQLRAAGAALSDIVHLTCYLVDESHFAAYSEHKRKLFANDPPAGTTVIVKGLLLPGLLLEVKVEAVVS